MAEKLDVSHYEIDPTRLTIVCKVPMGKMGLYKSLLNDKQYHLYLKREEKKRSLSANAYMWKLCDEIAKAIRSTKENVYKKAICDVGVFDTFRIEVHAYYRLEGMWESKGTGWFLEIVDQCERRQGGNEYTVNAYYGSSTYSSKEMARLIDWLVDEAQELGIDTMTPRERSLLIDKWKPEV